MSVSSFDFPAGRTVWAFAGFRFESGRGLSRAGRAIHLQPIPARVLQVLLAEQGRIVSKDELARRCWRGIDTADGSISRSIYQIRRALHLPQGVALIETVSGQGFRMAAPVHCLSDTSTSSLHKLTQVRHPSAFGAWVAARDLLARRRPRDLAAAVDTLARALADDPHYAPAWSLLGAARILQANYGMLSAREALALAGPALERALMLDPDSADAMARRGLLRVLVNWDPEAGFDDLDGAVQIDPEHWVPYHMRAWARLAVGRREEALLDAREAQSRNPYSPDIVSIVATCEYYGGNPCTALGRMKALAALPGASDVTISLAALCASAAGAHDQALSLARGVAASAMQIPLFQVPLGVALAGAGHLHEAREVLAAVQGSSVPVPPAVLACLHAALGDQAAAVGALLRARAEHCLHFGFARIDPLLEAVIDTPALAGAWQVLHGPRRVAQPDAAARRVRRPAS